MSSLKKRYSAMVSKLRDATKSNSNDGDTHSRALQLIDKSPESSKGYLASGKLHQQQGSLEAALDVYQQGLRSVPPGDRQYTKLQKEMDTVSASLAQRKPMLQYRLPYEIFSLVFRYVDVGGLITCSSVCQTWHEFLAGWPEFWDRFWDEIPVIMEGSTVDPKLRRECKEIRLVGQIGLFHAINIIRLANSTGALDYMIFMDMIIIQGWVHFLVDALQSTANPIKNFFFIDCTTPVEYGFVASFLKSCPNHTSVVFAHDRVTPPRMQPPRSDPKRWKIVKPKTQNSSLTLLRICAGYLNKNCTVQLAGILRQTPLLRHLILDGRAPIRQGFIMQQAIKHCPYLETIIFSWNAIPPPSQLYSIHDEDDRDLPDPSQKGKGLKRFVFTEYGVDQYVDDVDMVIEMSHMSLELLNLASSHTYILTFFAALGAPRLTEFHLFPDDMSVLLEVIKSDIIDAFATFFASCPNLKLIEVNGTYEDSLNDCGYFFIDEKVLQSIARNCPFLDTLMLVGCNHHGPNAMLDFAAAGGSQLTTLVIDMNPMEAPQLVARLPSLKALHIGDDYPQYRIANPEFYLSAAQRLLEARGGVLQYGRMCY